MSLGGYKMSLKTCRERKDFPIKKMVELLGVDRKTYYNWESKQKDIPSSMLIKIADILGCTINEILDYYPDSGVYLSKQDLIEVKSILYSLDKVLNKR